MTNPQIATILEDGTYGQREMTEEEYAELLASGWTLEPIPLAE
jgi:hypothetical protein